MASTVAAAQTIRAGGSVCGTLRSGDTIEAGPATITVDATGEVILELAGIRLEIDGRSGWFLARADDISRILVIRDTSRTGQARRGGACLPHTACCPARGQPPEPPGERQEGETSPLPPVLLLGPGGDFAIPVDPRDILGASTEEGRP